MAEILAMNEQKGEIIEAMCEYFSIDNPRFDRERFVKACQK